MRSTNSSVVHSLARDLSDPVVLNSCGIEWAIDRLQLMPGLLCAMGWCASRHGDHIAASLILVFADGESREFPLDCQLERPDVTEKKPDLRSNCGFFLYTAITAEKIPANAFFSVTQGNKKPIVIPLSAIHTENNSNSKSLFLHYLSRTIAHMLQGNWRLLSERIRTTYPALLAKRAKKGFIEELLESIPNQAILIVDHILGGGANHYRDNLIAEFSSRQRTVLLWTFSPVILTSQLELIPPTGERQSYKVDFSAWDALVGCEKIVQLIFNNAVSFPNPERIPEMLTRFASALGATRKLTLLVHDFFMVCPSHFLLNDLGQYCDIPDIGTCRSCLHATPNTLTRLFAARDIVLWRNLWLKVLQLADEIVCFSNNSRSLLLRAYPQLDGDAIQVRPHNLDYLTGNYRYPKIRKPIRVAMVGAISHHKGSDRFVALANAARSRSRDIEFFVIGSLIHQHKPNNIIETGSYLREQLPELLCKYEIHIALVLSVCPETFSYVTHELIHLGVPLITYAIGAQGEAAQRYPLGHVVEQCDADSLLDTIFEFKSELDNTLKETLHK